MGMATRRQPDIHGQARGRVFYGSCTAAQHNLPTFESPDFRADPSRPLRPKSRLETFQGGPD